MKITKFFVLAIMIVIISSCHDNIESTLTESPTESPTPDFDFNEWQKYIGKHFTSEFPEQFYWTQHYWEGYENDDDHQQFLQDCDLHSDDSQVQSLMLKYLTTYQFVDFFDLTDSKITMRVGIENNSHYNLRFLTDHQIKVKVKCPSPLSWINKEIEMPLIFEYNSPPSYCFFKGKYSDQYGFTYRSCGFIRSGSDIKDPLWSKFHISFYREEGHLSPFPQLKKLKFIQFSSYPIYEGVYKDLRPITYSFNKTTLGSEQSPITIQWESTAWKGEMASLMPSLSDFFQLLIGIPVLNPNEYYYEGIEDSEITIERVIRTAFPGVIQKSANIELEVNEFRPGIEEYGPLKSSTEQNPYNTALIISKIDDSRMCIVINARDISLENSKLKDRLFFANVIRSLLSEENCHFVMQYELIDCDLNDKSKEREFHMTLSDPQHSRNIMEYVILPLIIENREAIKEYIRQDAELSQHADVLCFAVDRLEEIYAGTTELTLGYRLIENQWH